MNIKHLEMLENAGFTTIQARALLQVIDESLKEHHALATKSDIQRLELAIGRIKSPSASRLMA